ncbi:MAG: DUF262 domain-containing protein [Deltaproteobacteria bacterium]|nr:DUF262 domain-containing protein [Deltaproteobacteria bacterium]
MIDEKKLLLPHIQRPFVWKQDRNNNQVNRFFDSIMRGYPFSTFLFWKTRDDIQKRKFIEDYKDGGDVKDTYFKSSEYQDTEKTFVLDGQQRLQALYLALKGTYNGKELYFDILSGEKLFWDKGDELKYNFEYFKRDEVEVNNSPEHYWVCLKEVVSSDDPSTKIGRNILKQMKEKGIHTEEIEDKVQDNVALIEKLFTDELIYYYSIDSTLGKFRDYEEILEIFIRVNSGGTQLSKSDLMFSLMKLKWDEAEEEFEDLLNDVNGQNVFAFDKDFVLKTSLVILDKKARYEVKKFKGTDGLESIKSRWHKIVLSFNWLRDFLDYARITSQSVLPSYNALIPILYFVYTYDCKPSAPKMKQNMQTWLYKTLLNNNFTGQADTIIDACTDVIKKHSSVDYFPYKEIENTVKTRLNKVVDINPNIIDGNTYLVLNLVYLFKNQKKNFQPKLKGNSPEIDHIFPKSKMLKTYKNHLVNNIGNYMFLEKTLNIEKRDKLPEVFFPDAIKESPNFLEDNFIPTEPRLQDPDNFEEFVEKRRMLMLDTIREVLTYQV